MPFGIYKGMAVILRAERYADDIEIWLRLALLFLSGRRHPVDEAEYLETLQQKNLRLEVFNGVDPFPVPHTAFMHTFNRFKRWVSLKRGARRLARVVRWARLRREIVEAAWEPRRLESKIDWWLDCEV